MHNLLYYLFYFFVDTSEFDALERNPSIEEVLNTPQSANQAMYIIIISITILILLVAIFVQYLI